MNILFISRNSPYESIGGIERYISNLIDYYKTETKTKLYLMLPTDGESHVKSNGRVVIYFENSIYLPRNKQSIQKEVSKKAPVFSKSVTEIIKKDKIDIVCAENFHTDLPPVYSLLLNMVAMSLKIPLVLQLHSFAVTELQTEIINQLKWDKISCVSKSVAGDCYQKGTDINYLSTHYLGVNTRQFKPGLRKNNNLKEKLNIPSDSVIILTATRIIRGKRNILREKGVINLIQAFSRISSRYPKLRLLLAIGKPPDNLSDEFNIAYEMLLGYIKLHGVEKQTIVKTFKLEDMPDVYRYSDVFVLPSENETFGQVFIEAMSSGIPVIGTKVGGIPEIISDSYNGYLVQPDDASILAQRMEKLINDKKTREDFTKAGIRTVRSNFTCEKQFLDFHKMLTDTVSANRQ